MSKSLSTVLNLQLPRLFQSLPFSSQIMKMRIPRTQNGAHVTSMGPNLIIWPHLPAKENGKFRLYMGSHGPSQYPEHLTASRKKKKKNTVGWLTAFSTVAELEFKPVASPDIFGFHLEHR